MENCVKEVFLIKFRMKRIQQNIKYLLNIFFLSLVLVSGVTCYPAQKNDILESQSEIRDEKHFPNGTTMGKYTYTDNEGNPIQVKYYADDASYGVELKSIKVVDSTGEPFQPAAATVVQNAPNKFDAEVDGNTAADLMNTNNFPELQVGFKYKSSELPNTYKISNKFSSKSNLVRSNPDYEVFYQNELNGPKKCGKEKVHVYFDAKENRKMRSVANDLADADKFCEQF